MSQSIKWLSNQYKNHSSVHWHQPWLIWYHITHNHTLITNHSAARTTAASLFLITNGINIGVQIKVQSFFYYPWNKLVCLLMRPYEYYFGIYFPSCEATLELAHKNHHDSTYNILFLRDIMNHKWWTKWRSSHIGPCLTFRLTCLRSGDDVITDCSFHNGPLTRYVNCGLRMRRECRERFPRYRLQRKALVSDPVMHHGTCVTHVPWCMSGSRTCDGGENLPGIPGARATRKFTYLARGPWDISIVMQACGKWYLTC